MIEIMAPRQTGVLPAPVLVLGGRTFRALVARATRLVGSSHVRLVPSISLVFPAWNEEEYVERAVWRALPVLERLTDDFEILIVDDASTDKTFEICQRLARLYPEVRVLHHEVNLKLGGALKTGFAATTKDVIVYSDIDLPWDLEELKRALHLMNYLEADMICAFRLDRTSEGAKRIVYSFAYNVIIRALFGVHVKDINFSFKVMHRRVLESIELKSTGSFIDAELVVKAIRHGFRVFQMGVDYFPRTRGVSTLSSTRVILKIARELAALYSETKHPLPPAEPVRAARDRVMPLEVARRAVAK